MKPLELFFGLIRIPLDLALAVAAFFSAYFLRAKDIQSTFIKKPLLEIFPNFPDFMHLAAWGAALLFAIFVFMHLYSMRVTTSYGTEIRKIVIGASIWLMAVITYYFMLREFPFSRLVLFYSWFFVILYLVAGRGIVHLAWRLLLRKGIGNRRLALFGDISVAHDLSEYFKTKKIYRLVGNARTLDELESLLKKHDVDEVVQTSEVNEKTDRSALDLCREYHAVYHFVPTVSQVARSNIETRTVAGFPLVTLKPTRLEGWGAVVKRAFDLFGSFFGLVLLSPFFASVALIVKIDSSGPIFFRYIDDGKTLALRVGHRGKKFCCLKFRTMRTNSHHLRYTQELLAKNVRKDSPLVKIQDDPRITRVGKFLRKFSIDELPQLWNVLKGEMSLVGPRPHLPEEVERYERHQKFVLTIRPGITGLAQISGRSDLQFDQEVRLDTYYIEHWSLLLDIKILIKTVLVVFRGYKE